MLFVVLGFFVILVEYIEELLQLNITLFVCNLLVRFEIGNNEAKIFQAFTVHTMYIRSVVAGVQQSAAEDDFGDFLSVSASPAQSVQPTQPVAPYQKLVTSAAGPKAIVTEPRAPEPKEEKKGMSQRQNILKAITITNLL